MISHIYFDDKTCVLKNEKKKPPEILVAIIVFILSGIVLDVKVHQSRDLTYLAL